MDNFENNNLPKENNNAEQEQFPKNELPPVTEAETAEASGSLPYTQPQQIPQAEQSSQVQQAENTESRRG